MSLYSSAPTRIDLAGGTLDLWPICHALGRPAVTVNLAIDLRAEVVVEETGDGFLDLASEDRGERVRLPVNAITHDRLGLATRLAQWFGAGDGLEIRMRCQAPPGSGLGGSSALAIALAGALGRLRGKRFDIPTVQNLETALLGTPTGYQDYYPPLHGGLNVLTAAPDGVNVERLDLGGEFLARHLLLADTRIEHHSGLTNWEVFRRFFDGEAGVRAALRRVAESAASMRDALRARDLDGVAAALRDEWAARRTLSPVVTNRKIDALAAAASAAGALAAKICGAGGGGCMVLVASDAGDPALTDAVERAGASIVPFRPAGDGLRLDGGLPPA